MKRLIVVMLVAAAMALSCAACGGGNESGLVTNDPLQNNDRCRMDDSGACIDEIEDPCINNPAAEGCAPMTNGEATPVISTRLLITFLANVQCQQNTMCTSTLEDNDEIAAGASITATVSGGTPDYEWAIQVDGKETEIVDRSSTKVFFKLPEGESGTSTDDESAPENSRSVSILASVKDAVGHENKAEVTLIIQSESETEAIPAQIPPASPVDVESQIPDIGDPVKMPVQPELQEQISDPIIPSSIRAEKEPASL